MGASTYGHNSKLNYSHKLTTCIALKIHSTPSGYDGS